MTIETRFRIPRLPHLPQYKDAQNQADEPKNVKQYREDLHRALQEGLIQIDAVLGPSGSGPVSITATTPIVVTPSPLVNTGVITHAASGVTLGTYGDASNIPQVTVDAKGHVTGVTNVAISGVGTTLSITLPATQALTAGDLVNIWSSSGTPSVRKASATSGYEAHGFTNAAVSNGATCTVQLAGLNTHSSGLTAGRVFLHTTDGLVSNTCPSTAGQMGQEVGEAYASGSYNFAWHPGVLLATVGSTGNAGVLKGQEFTSSGTFTPPTGVTSVWITAIGGGSGGSNQASALGGGGGGAGELIENFAVIVSGPVTVTIGAGGAGAPGNGSGNASTAGGDTSFGSVVIARGAAAATSAGASGAGGGTNGSTSKTASNPGNDGTVGTAEAPTHFGGGSGGGGSSTTSSNGGLGAGAGPYGATQRGTAAATQGGGGGGASTIYGLGGAGGGGGSAGSSAASTSYVAGGGGAGGKTGTSVAGGNGAAGYVLVQYIS